MARFGVSLPVAVVVLTTLVAAAVDVWKFKIHNILTWPLILTGLIYRTAAGGLTDGWPGAGTELGQALLGMFAGGGLLLPFYALGGKGAGDVKLMAGIGAWLGWQAALAVFVLSSLAEGAYALGLLIFFGGWRETVNNLKNIGRQDGPLHEGAAHPHPRRRLIPYGLMMALAVVLLASWPVKPE